MGSIMAAGAASVVPRPDELAVILPDDSLLAR
jgi:hypothetical protein